MNNGNKKIFDCFRRHKKIQNKQLIFATVVLVQDISIASLFPTAQQSSLSFFWYQLHFHEQSKFLEIMWTFHNSVQGKECWRKERSNVKEARMQVVSNVSLNKPRWCIFKLKSHHWFKIKQHLFRWHWKAYTLTFCIIVTFV